MILRIKRNCLNGDIMQEEWVYTTRRIQLQKRLKYLLETIESAQKAVDGLLSGDIQSYSLGSYSITRAKPDIDKLQKLLKTYIAEADAIQNILTGKPARKTSTCVYSNPQNLRWWI